LNTHWSRWAKAAIGALLVAAPALAQIPLSGSTRELVAVNTDVERYLRVMQVTGLAPAYPWSVRELGPREVDALIPTDTTHPWLARVRPMPHPFTELYWLAPEATVIYNSAFPYGFNDGALWAGRGLTTAFQAGFAGHVGRLSFTVEPMLFRTQNTAFALRPNGQSGRLQYADGANPLTIDQPQRFGDRPYQQLDPGQTTVRLDLPVVALGISTANQHWGPAIDNPIILGNNAAGFPHLFVGTSSPLDLYLFRAYGRVEWGRLDQSSYAVLSGTQSRRFMSGLAGSISPRGLNNLEIGGTRFFHTLWPDSGLTKHDFLRPFEGLLLSSVASQIGNGSGQEPDNQLASVFARWTFPRSGVEIYGEVGREDHNQDLHDLTLEPDHISAYTLGLEKVYRRASGDLLVVRGELINARVSSLNLVRGQGPFYVHSPVVQGHTERGQLLGSPAGYGGAGSVIAVHQYCRDGSWSITWNRAVRSPPLDDTQTFVDVAQSLELVRTRFLRSVDVTSVLTVTKEFNRNLDRDAMNLHIGVFLRPRF